MRALRSRRSIVATLAALALALGCGAAACDLNPQPIPPGFTTDDAGVNGGEGDASQSADGAGTFGTGDDAGAGGGDQDVLPVPGDAAGPPNDDAGDSGPDGGDGGPLDAGDAGDAG